MDLAGLDGGIGCVSTEAERLAKMGSDVVRVTRLDAVDAAAAKVRCPQLNITVVDSGDGGTTSLTLDFARYDPAYCHVASVVLLACAEGRRAQGALDAALEGFEVSPRACDAWSDDVGGPGGAIDVDTRPPKSRADRSPLKM